MASPISVELDAKALARFAKRVEKWQGRPLSDRMGRGTIEAARLMVGPIRALTPRGTGNLSRSVKAQSYRAAFSGGTIASAKVGPTARHRALVIWGTKPHSLATKRTGRSPWVAFGSRVFPAALVSHPGATANPFVDKAVQATSNQAFAEIVRQLRV